MGSMPQVAEWTEDQGSPDLYVMHSRAGFLHWLGKAGIGVVAATATFLADRRQSSASSRAAGAPSHGYHVSCCHLANPHDSSCRCLSGRLEAWTCCDGGRLVQCTECEDPAFPPTDTCWKGYFICSRVVDIGAGC
jgi:hypothetical protein